MTLKAADQRTSSNRVGRQAPIRHLSEETTARLVTHQLALEAAREAMIAVSAPSTSAFPPVLGHSQDAKNRFSVKAATAVELTGLKVGSYWHENPAHGRPAHSSTILLFNAEDGRIDTVIEASAANGFRTAAANALATSLLSNPGAERLALFGAGAQADYEVQALRLVRPLNHVSIVNRNEARAHLLRQKLQQSGLNATVCGPGEACRDADIIVTATASRAALFEADMVKAGAHVSAMGADGPGKQELPIGLLRRAKLFCDWTEQSVRIGEFQHVANEISIGELHAVQIGDLLTGRAGYRHSESEITIFDSSGLALQDLFLARRLLVAAADERRMRV